MQPQNQTNFGGISQFDLFKQVGTEGKQVDQEDSNDTRIALDLSKFKDLWQIDAIERKPKITKSQDDSKGHDQIDTESDSCNKFEYDLKQYEIPEIKNEKKTEKSEIGSLINDERRRLLKKLDSCDDERIIFKRREKNSKKDPKVSADTYRGSRYWGVSKNKSKWQVSNYLRQDILTFIKVMITLNHFKDYKGGFDSEDEAARMYDRKSICTFGLKAKTNFDYTKRQVCEILRNDESIIL
jgi:hypothetical protein